MNERPSRYTRRTALLAVSALVPSALAGCNTIGEMRSSPPTLGEVHAENDHADESTIEIVVELDGERIHASSHDLEGRDTHGGVDGEHVDRSEWDGSTGTFVVKARIRGTDEWEETDITEYGDADCYTVTARREAVDRERGEGTDRLRFRSTEVCTPAADAQQASD